MTSIDFHNATHLSDDKILSLYSEGVSGWAFRKITVRVRYSRGADFSGTCFYADRRVFVNIGKHLTFPYCLRTNLARAKTVGRRWYRPAYTIEVNNGEDLAVFIFMHEVYHLLVKRAKRNTRQKESMCDRFAARFLVERCGSIVLNQHGVEAPRADWDWQDLNGFVAAARSRRAARRPIKPRGGLGDGPDDQLLLFGT